MMYSEDVRHHSLYYFPNLSGRRILFDSRNKSATVPYLTLKCNQLHYGMVVIFRHLFPKPVFQNNLVISAQLSFIFIVVQPIPNFRNHQNYHLTNLKASNLSVIWLPHLESLSASLVSFVLGDLFRYFNHTGSGVCCFSIYVYFIPPDNPLDWSTADIQRWELILNIRGGNLSYSVQSRRSFSLHLILRNGGKRGAVLTASESRVDNHLHFLGLDNCLRSF